MTGIRQPLTHDEATLVIGPTSFPPGDVSAAYELCVVGREFGDVMLYRAGLEALETLIPDPPDGVRGTYYRMADGTYVGKGEIPGCACPKGKVNLIYLAPPQQKWQT